MAEQENLVTQKDRDKATRMLIGKQIRKHRSAQNLTQEALAAKIGRNLSANSLSRYETGETEMGVVTYFAIATALGAAPNDLAPSVLIKNVGLATGPQSYEKLTDDRKYIIDQIIGSLLCQQENQK